MNPSKRMHLSVPGCSLYPPDSAALSVLCYTHYISFHLVLLVSCLSTRDLFSEQSFLGFWTVRISILGGWKNLSLSNSHGQSSDIYIFLCLYLYFRSSVKKYIYSKFGEISVHPLDYLQVVVKCFPKLTRILWKKRSITQQSLVKLSKNGIFKLSLSQLGIRRNHKWDLIWWYLDVSDVWKECWTESQNFGFLHFFVIARTSDSEGLL